MGTAVAEVTRLRLPHHPNQAVVHYPGTIGPPVRSTVPHWRLRRARSTDTAPKWADDHPAGAEVVVEGRPTASPAIGGRTCRLPGSTSRSCTSGKAMAWRTSSADSTGHTKAGSTDPEDAGRRHSKKAVVGAGDMYSAFGGSVAAHTVPLAAAEYNGMLGSGAIHWPPRDRQDGAPRGPQQTVSADAQDVAPVGVVVVAVVVVVQVLRLDPIWISTVTVAAVALRDGC